jgi:hypothetical protein
MEQAFEERFVVYVRSRRDLQDPPEDGEWPAIACSSYEEANKIRQAHRLHARDCVIRFIGPAGGGD